MKNCFRIDSQPIIIYGAAATGLIVYEICKEMGIPVLGFIDKRGDEILEVHGIRVYGIDSREIDLLDKECTVFVAVKNVFEHDNIVRELIGKGFSNIIYRPYAVINGKGNEQEKILYKVYDKFMSKELSIQDIPKTQEVCRYEYIDYATIEKLDGKRIVQVPIESLFTDLKKGIKQWRWLNIPVMALIPHIAFFKWMDQQDGFSYDMYLQFCIDSTKVKGQIKTTERWKQNVIRNRANVYANMNESLERDFDFFIRNAPDAKWNPEGYFNLVSGKHRAAFWIAKGRHYIPLKISEEDFVKWINEKKANKIIQKLEKLNVYSVKAPVEHPFFYNLQCENKTLYFHLLCDFIFTVSIEQYDKTGYVNLKELETVFVSLNDDGYIARALQRYGVPVEIHNKNDVSMILEDLVILDNRVKESSEYSYALVEFRYGEELCFEEIMAKKIEHMFCFVSFGQVDEFEQIIEGRYVRVQKREIMKDGEYFLVYTLGDEK